MSLAKRLARRALSRVCHMAGDRGQTLVGYDCLGYLPNLAWPQSHNEKLLRRTISRFPADWSKLADKVAVRDWVAERIGPEYLNEVYLVTDRADDIRFSTLPNSFVIKANHGSGWNRLVADASVEAEADIRERADGWLRSTYGVTTNEGWYAGIRPRLLVESFLKDDEYGIPLDYKFWVFRGSVLFVQVDIDRFSAHSRNFYDSSWQAQNWGLLHRSGRAVTRPRHLSRMKALAEALAVGFDFVRIDFYCVNDERILFGEVTLCPGAGVERFWPTRDIDFRLGSYW